jgi:predicted enzyme related to lactoylglutathione lyase
MSGVRLYHNLFCHDIEAQMRFYMQLLGLPEAVHARSPIYRAIATPQFQLGFHAPEAYALLQLHDRVPPAGHEGMLGGYPTFMLPSPEAVTAGAERAAVLGGRVIKAPYATYYGEWQAVLADPEDHVLRLSCASLPAGVQPPDLDTLLPATP